ncbi:glycosyltransferase family 4 protein [Azospirillum thermophilum]|uniref:glycosyltransferase family 4 protein n=1 Tax=Azospirillum thermophilum TaxID=2202148 RepID=UPI0011B38F15|nr:glycosyltransferase family 4 protein [Azospirillum thermophilum]
MTGSSLPGGPAPRPVLRRRLKVLIVGHACCPGVGSEPGLTWNWATSLAEHHDVWLVAHPAHRDRVEAALADRPVPGLSVHWVELGPSWDPWDRSRGERGIHLHYLLWQHAAFRESARLHGRVRFDVTHHVSWGTINAPPRLWQLDVPFVWGPIGGGQSAPLRFRRYLGPGVAKEALRATRLALLPLQPSLRAAARRSAAVLATNRETARLLERAGCPVVHLFLDNGVTPDALQAGWAPPADRLELLWAGRIETRKALPLALHAMARMRTLPVRLTVAGDGAERQRCQALAASLGLQDSVRFLGMVPRERMDALFAGSSALLFTSLQDAFGSVVLEAMAAGLPVLGLDHQGVGAMIPDQAALKAPVTSPAAAIAGLEQGMRRLLADHDLLRRMGAAARAHAATESWPERARRMADIYHLCVEQQHGHSAIPEDDRPGALLPHELA